jgi:hypothetical protein
MGTANTAPARSRDLDADDDRGEDHQRADADRARHDARLHEVQLEEHADDHDQMAGTTGPAPSARPR